MRGFLRGLALLAFFLCSSVALAGTWLTNTFGDEQGFVESTQVIAHDENVQNSISLWVNIQVEQHTNLSGTRIAEATSQALQRATASESFDEAWSESMRRLHAQLFDDTTSTEVVLDVVPFIDLVINDSRLLSSLGISAPEEVLITIAAIDVRPVTTTLTAADQSAWWFGVAALVSAAIAFAAATRRSRPHTVIALGGLTAFAALAVALAGRFGLEIVSRHRSVDRSHASILDALSERAIDSLDAFLVPAAAVGLALAAFGVLWRALSRRGR